MFPYKIISIQDNQLTISQMWGKKQCHTWQVNLPTGVVVNGYCKDARYLKQLMKWYAKQYGGSFLPKKVFCSSSDMARWHMTLPVVKQRERKSILNYEGPIDGERYRRYYEVERPVDGQQSVYIVGVPHELQKSYESLFSKKWMRRIGIGCEVDRLSKELAKGMEEDFLIYNQTHQRLEVALVVDGHCVVCQSTSIPEGASNEERGEMCEVQVFKMRYFYEQYYPKRQLSHVIVGMCGEVVESSADGVAEVVFEKDVTEAASGLCVV